MSLKNITNDAFNVTNVANNYLNVFSIYSVGVSLKYSLKHLLK